MLKFLDLIKDQFTWNTNTTKQMPSDTSTLDNVMNLFYFYCAHVETINYSEIDP